MTEVIDNLINQAITAAKSGDRNQARKILTDALDQNQNDARIWYLLSQVVDNRDQQIKCLEKALELQPNNPKIVDKLRKLNPAPLPELDPEPVRLAQKTIDKPKQKTAWWVYALLIIFVPILSCFCLGVIFSDSDSTETIKNSLKGYHSVVYRIEGNASSALITYMNEQAGVEQQNDALLPWTKSYEMKTGSSTSLVAQSGDYGRTITCIIELDGKEWKRSTSSGDFVVVTCAGWIGLE